MNSDDLKVFLAVAEECSVTKAAERLGYVQSNVTARIQQLETHLGTKLFHRHARGMSVTPEGNTLRSYAEKIMYLLEDARRDVQDSATPRGPLSIGSIDTAAAVRVPTVLAKYHDNYADVDLSLVTGSSEYLLEQVLRSQLDGAFVNGPIEHVDLIQETIFREELVLVSNRQEMDPAVLKGKTLLVFRRGCTYRAKLEQWLSTEGIATPRTMEFGNLDAILGGVRAGLGVTLLPKSVVERLEADGSVSTYPIPSPHGQASTVFIRRQDRFVTSALSAFMGILQSQFWLLD
ncbi:MAG: hypothetical protein A2201_06845 [Alicyclobacillus sp. RIFOXYA1_FULL_53_8]|nr:MAG: hypothetical protein A2201_06845 [Alicyclobacillus sp. RIFOXYA1_FULL_53_8]